MVKYTSIVTCTPTVGDIVFDVNNDASTLLTSFKDNLMTSIKGVEQVA